VTFDTRPCFLQFESHTLLIPRKKREWRGNLLAECATKTKRIIVSVLSLFYSQLEISDFTAVIWTVNLHLPMAQRTRSRVLRASCGERTRLRTGQTVFDWDSWRTDARPMASGQCDSIRCEFDSSGSGNTNASELPMARLICVRAASEDRRVEWMEYPETSIAIFESTRS